MAKSFGKRKKGNRFLFIFTFIIYVGIPLSAFSAKLFSRGETQLNLKGYYKNILQFSETIYKEDYYSDTNRLRLELDSFFTSKLTAKLVYDHELIAGNILKTEEFKILKGYGENTYYDLDKVLGDDSHKYWKHSLYRFYVKYNGKITSLTVGRQRIALGVGKIWNPEDIINPVNPLSIERDEKTGADALNLELHSGDFSSTALIYAKKSEKDITLLKTKLNIKKYDLSAMGGKFGRDEIIGLDFSGYVGDSGFRGEWTYSFSREQEDFQRFVLSWDYTFKNSLYILLEYLHNGGNMKVRDENFIRQSLENIATINRNFLGTAAGYELTPLIRFDTYSIFDPEDLSIFINPSLTYNLFQNLDWTIGAQLFSGKSASEYGFFSNAYYTRAQWYF